MSGVLKNSSSLIPGLSLGDLQLQQPQHFTIHLDHIEPHEPIQEFHGVVGELIHKDDYVGLPVTIRLDNPTGYNTVPTVSNLLYYLVSCSIPF